MLGTMNYKVNWKASEASETLSGVYKFELVQYMYGGTWTIIVVLWEELGHSHFFFIHASYFKCSNHWEGAQKLTCVSVCV